jgi:hypothetical protein
MKQKKIRAVVIHATKKQVFEIEIENTLDGIYKAGDFDIMEVAVRLKNKDCLMVDEEGLLKNLPFFFFDGNQFFGNGVVVQDYKSAESTVEEIASLVTFC